MICRLCGGSGWRVSLARTERCETCGGSGAAIPPPSTATALEWLLRTYEQLGVAIKAIAAASLAKDSEARQ